MDEDDYMTMTFEDDYTSTSASSKKRKPVETSLQRRMRLERAGRERGHVLSKAEQARAAEKAREAALNRSLFDGTGGGSAPAAQTKPSKGFAMMAKMGFVAGQALGKKTAGDAATDKDRPLTEPIRIQVKRDRAGIGADEERKAKEEAEDEDEDEEKEKKKKAVAVEVDPYAYRDRIRREREQDRLERLIHAAQTVAERLANGDDDNENENGDDETNAERDTQPLSDVNVLWRGMVKQRRAKEHERALQRRSEARLASSLRGLGGGEAGGGAAGDASDDEIDAPRHSYLATGMSTTVVEDDDNSDNGNDTADDDELTEFDALPALERLQQVVDWMRLNRRYCFWCKHKYASDDLDGCPGPTEADHD